jgi:shikimate dehydrogenase
MHNATLSADGLDYWYLPFAVHPDRLSDAVAGMRALGIAGFSVTIPHKVAVIPFLDQLDESAEAAGAVNTVANRDGMLVGYNTDGDGLIRSLASEFGFCCAESGTIIIVGAGGACRGAVAAFCRSGASRIIIINRSRGKAEEVALICGERYPGTEIIVADNSNPLHQYLRDTSLVVNSTSLGMKGESIPFLNLNDLPQSAAVYDMVYAPPLTPLLKEAASRGLKCANGLGMLAAQGEIAYRIWTGFYPPSGVMREALLRTLTPITTA